MPFSEVIGQKPAVKVLQRSLKQERMAHAYLFVGPEGVGKKLVARILVQIINCDKGNADACGKCLSCQKIENFSHPNVTWVKPGGLSRRIGIDDIRDLRHRISLKAYYAGQKQTFVLVEADRMTAEAGNALLKTLEEPPADSMLILLTSHPSSLLPTIVSRCQTIRFSPIPPREIKDYLVSRFKLPSDEARLLSRLSEGRLGKALSLRDKAVREERKKVLDIVSHISPTDDLKELLRQAADIGEMLSGFKRGLEEKLKGELSKEKEEMLTREQIKEIKEERLAFLEGESKRKIREILDIIISWYRDILILKEGGEETSLINLGRNEELRARAKAISLSGIRNSIDVVEKTKQYIEGNINLRLSLEVMMMKLQEEIKHVQSSPDKVKRKR